MIKSGALFSGIGGFCLGFEGVGIKTSWAVEQDEYAVATYCQNIHNVSVFNKDIKFVNSGKIDLEPVDIIHAGFPCQSFSQAGSRKGFDDPRGMLFFDMMRVINAFKDKKPTIIVLENSPYIKVGDSGRWFMSISQELRKSGYWFREYNSAELDTYELTPLPQKRNRLFMVALSTKKFRNGRFTFPADKYDGKKDLQNYIDFNGSIDDDYYYLDDQNKYFKMISESGDDKSCIYQLRKYLVRVKEHNVCPTLTANMGMGGHNVPFIHDSKGIRKLTETECLKLQGFPEEFSFPSDVIRSARYKQIGNSVSPLVVKLLAVAILNKLQLES